MRPPRIVLGLVFVSLAAPMTGCGAGDSADQAEMEQARHEGAVAAHQADELRELKREVSALKHDPGRQPSSSEAGGGTPPVESEVAADSRIPESGTYSGEAAQRGTPAAVNKSYPLTMTFSSGGSYITYPSLGCEGSLQPIGFEGSNRIYEEHISSGHCDSGGIWLVHVDGPTTLEAGWSLPTATYTVTAVLNAD